MDQDRPESPQSPLLHYQLASEVHLAKVPPEVATIKLIANQVADYPSEKDGVEKQLEKYYWWFNSGIIKDGFPDEQVIIEILSHKINVYNFGEAITDQELIEIRKAISIVARVDKGEHLKKLQYLLLQKKDVPNPLDNNLLQYGYAMREAQTITINPAGRQPIPHRIQESSRLCGTLIHEMGHFIIISNDDFKTAWNNKFWNSWNEEEKTDGSSHRACSEPQRCINTYSSMSNLEDMAESLTAYLSGHELDSERKQLIETFFSITPEEKMPETDLVDKRKGQGVQLPRVDYVLYSVGKKLEIKKLRPTIVQ